MEANFYIMAESFEHNSTYTLSELKDKTNEMAIDILRINKLAKNDKLFSNFSCIYPTKFYKNITIEDILCRPKDLHNVFDRDFLNSFQKIFEKAKDTQITSNEVISTLLPWHDKNICHGLIVFHKIENVSNDIQLIYGVDCWFKFKRYFLAKYPDEKTFLSECATFFPNLFFHNRIESYLSTILPNFSWSIIKHLSALNDVFFTYRNRKFRNESEKYQAFTTECNLDDNAASKDTINSKEQLTYNFINYKGDSVEVTCYPHLKLCKSDTPGDNKYYFNRIYFHEGIDSIQNKKILIGHIGNHRD